ncbi:MAG: ABC transporter permease subunit [Thermoprotei archaeon]|nr:ABC transporter permease subunit [Thermoprotei archaeon]
MKALEIARVEFGNIVRSNKFLAIVAIFTLMLLSGLCRVTEPSAATFEVPSATTHEVERVESDVKLGLKVMNAIGYSVLMLVPVVAVMLGFDVISGKVEKGIVRTLLAQPVFRDHIIAGTFVAGLTSLLVGVAMPLALSLSLAVLLLGITPSLADVALLITYLGVVAVFALAYYALSVFFSTVTGNSVKSLVAGILVWLFSSFMLPSLSTAIIRLLLGPPKFEQVQMGQMIVLRTDPDYMRKFTDLQNKILSLTLDYHFRVIQDQLLLGPGIKDYTGLLVLIAFSLATLIASFTVFVKREVR